VSEKILGCRQSLQKEATRKWALRNPERVKASREKSRTKNREKTVAARRAKRRANPEIYRQQSKEYALKKRVRHRLLIALAKEILKQTGATL
jgi:hypothetical protein